MINKIKQWFESEQPIIDPVDINLASAALMVEVMMADLNAAQDEIHTISHICQTQLGLDAQQTASLTHRAQEKVADANDLYQFTKVITSQFNEQQRLQVLINLWRVAFADGKIDAYEDAIIRRIGELLHLHHSHFIKAKHIARDQKV